MFLNNLSSDDVIVECIMSDENKDEAFDNYQAYRFEPEEQEEDGSRMFGLDLDTNASGVQYFRIRMYPYHQHLCHSFETGKMIWLEE